MDEGKMIKTKCKEIINKDEESRGGDIMKIIVLSRKDSKEYILIAAYFYCIIHLCYTRRILCLHM